MGRLEPFAVSELVSISVANQVSAWLLRAVRRTGCTSLIQQTSADLDEVAGWEVRLDCLQASYGAAYLGAIGAFAQHVLFVNHFVGYADDFEQGGNHHASAIPSRVAMDVKGQFDWRLGERPQYGSQPASNLGFVRLVAVRGIWAGMMEATCNATQFM